MMRLIVFLATTAVFTILGIVVGHLIVSGLLETATGSHNNVGSEIAVSYGFCSLGGLVTGLVVSCMGLWFFGPASKN